MRQRRPKNLEEKINKYMDYLVQEPMSQKQKWIDIFESCRSDSVDKHKKLYLEIGSGKGRFINQLAMEDLDSMFIGFEGQDTVILRALEKVDENELRNLKFCQYYINDFTDIFGENELDGIYLNFSDPWPKERHEKRRLTSPRYLDGYVPSLKEEGFIEMKTDNVELFDYSVAQLERHSRFIIQEISRDLHNSKYNETNVMTEYEKKFTNLNKKINYVHAIKRGTNK